MRGLLIPTHGTPELLSDDLLDSKYLVFGQAETLVSTFDGRSNYYHYPQDLNNIHPVNVIATILKRRYTNNYKLFLKGDILVYSSSDSLPNVIDDNVDIHFLQQVLLYIDQVNESRRY